MTKKTIGTTHHERPRLLSLAKQAEKDQPQNPKAERGVATNVHYKPLPMMTAYKKMGFDIKDFPNAFAAFDNEITLPLNTKMTEVDLVYVENASFWYDIKLIIETFWVIVKER